MSFGGTSTAALPSASQKPLGLDENRASTNEQARPVPYMAGKTRLGVTWLTDAFAIETEAVTSSAGKGQTSIRGYNYFADLAALICHGPVDLIEKIYFNSEEVWSGALMRDSEAGEDYADIDIEGHGSARIYWGTPTQDVSPILIGSGYSHPPYKRQCYMVFERMYFGFNQTNAPNVEVVIGRYPKPGWMTAAVDINGDCNPVAIIAEWLQSKIFGLGLIDGMLDTTALDEIAQQLEAEEIGLSPYITKATSARQLISQLCEYFDGFPLLTAEGKFKLGLARAAEDEGALPLIDESNLLDIPDLDPESWASVRTKTWVKFMDSSRDWKESALPYRAAGASQVYGDNTPQTLDRTWVTNAQLAQKIVAATGRTQALPSTGGEFTVNKSVDLSAGDLFRLSYDKLGISNMVMRVVTRAAGNAGERSITLTARIDRSYLNDAFYLPDDDETPVPVDTSPASFEEDAQGLMELPVGLAVAGKITVAPLVARPNFYTTGYNIWLRRNYDLGSAYPPSIGTAYIHEYGNGTVGAEDYPLTQIVDETVGCLVTFSDSNWTALDAYARAGKLVIDFDTELTIVLSLVYISTGLARAYLIRARTRFGMKTQSAGKGITYYYTTYALFTLNYDQIGSDNQFAKHGTVAEDYPATDLIDERTGLLVEIDPENTIIESPSLNNALSNELLVFVGDEILSVVTATKVNSSPIQYRLYCIRGRYDTRAVAHSTGESVFVIERSKLKLLTNSAFQKGTRPTFKLQPTVLSKQVDLADVIPVGITLSGRINQPGSPVNLAAFDDGYNPVYTTGQDILLTWNLTEIGARDFWGRWGNPALIPAQTVLKFYTSGDVLKRTITTAAGATSYTYTNAALTADFGSEQTIKVTAQTLQNGLYSRFTELLTVTFV